MLPPRNTRPHAVREIVTSLSEEPAVTIFSVAVIKCLDKVKMSLPLINYGPCHEDVSTLVLGARLR
jgi:hypothetical protein